MKVALRKNPGIIECIQIPKPEIKPDEVLIKVVNSGICGSDINRIAENDEKWNKVVLGHEFSGIIVEAGNNVSTVGIGDRVSAAPLLPCHECASCRQGLFSLCKSYSFIGSRQNGTFAEYVAVPAINTIKIPESLSFEKAALLEPVTVCLHPILRLGNIINANVVIIGAGTIGLLSLQIFKAIGAGFILVSDIDDEKLEIAKSLGADITVNVTKNSLEDTCSLFMKDGADIIFETSGNNNGKKSAIRIAKGRGSILLIGTTNQDITFSASLFELITRKELNLTGSWMNYSAPWPGKEWTSALAMLEKGKIITQGIITHHFSLENIGQAFAMIFSKKESFTKVMISME